MGKYSPALIPNFRRTPHARGPGPDGTRLLGAPCNRSRRGNEVLSPPLTLSFSPLCSSAARAHVGCVHLHHGSKPPAAMHYAMIVIRGFQQQVDFPARPITPSDSRWHNLQSHGVTMAWCQHSYQHSQTMCLDLFHQWACLEGVFLTQRFRGAVSRGRAKAFTPSHGSRQIPQAKRNTITKAM